MKSFAKWLFKQEISGNKDNICAPPLDAQEALDFLKDYLLGDNWYAQNSISNRQVNCEIVNAILLKYSRRFKKEIKEERRQMRK